MKKVFVLCFFMMLIFTTLITARDVVGHISTDDPVPIQLTLSSIVSESEPGVYHRAMVFRSPQQVINFFVEKGIDPESLNDDYIPATLKLVLCSICKDCCEEFNDVLRDVVAQYEGTSFDTYIVQVGDLYWTFYV